MAPGGAPPHLPRPWPARTNPVAKTTPEDLLRVSRLRLTPTRRRVLDVLLRARKPLSHQELMQRLADGATDRVTVYRTLTRLVEAGVVHEAFVSDRTRLYETADRCHADHCHAHFTCRQCEQTTCLVTSEVPIVRDLPGGFVPERQKVLIEGLCPKCAAQGRGRRSDP